MTRLSYLLALACCLAAPGASAQSAADVPATAPVEPVPIAEPPAAPPVSEPTAPSSGNEVIAATPPEPAGMPLPMSAAELDALGINTTNQGTDTALDISGFADFTFARQFTPKTSVWRANGIAPAHSSFYVGSFNLYIRKNLTESLRTLGEVRFSYLPNGSSEPYTRETTSTASHDYTDFGRIMRWGGIQIQRLYLEWTAHPLIAIRGGQFLTPYGIWNVDHGTPVYIPTQRPFVVGGGLFPERQTGLELFGRWDATADVSIGYHLTLSNGTGPVSEYLDLDENKAIGGRLYFEYRGLGELRIGGSVYYGRETAAVNGFFLDSSNRTGSRERLDSQFDSLAWAADLLWKLHGWHLQVEWISYQRAYTPRGRTSVQNNGLVQVPADSDSWGIYGIIGHRFHFFGVMPFVLLEYQSGLIETSGVSTATIQAGLNCRPIDSLTLKLEYSHLEFSGSVRLSGTAMNMLQAQVAWTF